VVDSAVEMLVRCEWEGAFILDAMGTRLMVARVSQWLKGRDVSWPSHILVGRNTHLLGLMAAAEGMMGRGDDV